MGVAHGHLDGGMPKKLLNDSQRHPARNKLRGKRMPKRMPANGPHTSSATDAPESLTHCTVRQGLPIGSGKDESRRPAAREE